MNAQFKILIVDDEPLLLKEIKRIVEKNGFEVYTAGNGEQALELIKKNQFALVMSDMNMPGINGLQFLEKARKISPESIKIILSGNTDVDMVLGAINKDHVYRYITKPFDNTELIITIKQCIDYYSINQQKKILTEQLAQQNEELKNLNRTLEEKIKQRSFEIENLNFALVSALSNINYFNDDETGAHIKRVGEYSRVIAEGYELPISEIKQIEMYAKVHDIGKVGIPTAILKKIGRYTPEEFNLMKNHSFIGYQMIDNPCISKIAKNIVLYHHEKFDGTGYPDKLKGTDIPIEARIVALADVYDALISKRTYKPAFAEEIVYNMIIQSSGSHFDPDIVKIYKKNRFVFYDLYLKNLMYKL